MRSNAEKRKDGRSVFPYYVEYVLSPGTSEETLHGAVIDISDSGLCLCGCAMLTEGQEITIRSDLPRLRRKARVRWVTRLKNGLYKAGIMFT
jgi:hypothetical protein